MAAEPVNYRKLGGPAVRSDNLMAGTATRVALYLGPDHLLLTEKVWFKESYRRFYFKDIQAFLIQKTNRWLWWSLGFLLAALFFGVFGLAASGSGAGIVFYSIAGVLALCLGINWMLGQTCRCYLKTAVQYEELTPLNRERKADRALALMEDEIEAVQGRMPAPGWNAAPAPEPAAPQNLPEAGAPPTESQST
jgi:hypothetical protein